MKIRRINGLALLAGLVTGLWLVMAGAVFAAAPVVTNIKVSQRSGTKLVDIYYDVSAAGPVTISAQVSNDGGATYAVTAKSFTGDYGTGVSPGQSKHIVWDAGTDTPNQKSGNMRIKIVADDNINPTPTPTPPSGNMVFIPAGEFSMGDPYNEGYGDELPVHKVTVSAFYMEKYLVTGAP
ncbi:MAG: SUMF1/EgtB/PvdO family nonheme iron enzyme, partial [Deltaproteobacteria bacterium]|nr:SUMF1/EgtB/PvdO family nonheme iron enzyme [Deltaproteobacteria bacterium]